MNIFLLFIIILFIVETVLAHRGFSYENLGSFCKNNTPHGSPNLLPIETGLPRLIRNIENGSLYQIGIDDDQTWLIHVWGMNGYDYGFAYGTLLNEQINKFMPKTYAYFEKEVMEKLDHLQVPDWFKRIIANKGLAFALDLQNTLVEPYMDKEIYNELQGISDAAKIDYKLLLRIHMFGELTRAHCSYFGAWGKATLGGKTLQLRAFDWDMSADLQAYPVITIYHPRSSKLGHTFTNIAWAGYIGVLSGMSSTLLGMTSIGVEFPDDTFGDESMSGEPFIFVSRHILQYSQTLDDALAYISDVRRTCHLIMGIADGKLNTARMIQYSHSKVNFFDDLNLQPAAEWHPQITNVVYNGMDWLCPSYQYKLYQQIMEQYGHITPESTIQNISAIVKTGDVHVAVYDLSENILYLANGGASGKQGPKQAYQRQFNKLDLKIEYDRKQPSIDVIED
ncbi:unnamed protein product [Adineta steineri]|uniref:Acid ceramidase-like protein n=1 Tax=Adineta steineri TaxID=433720 RepID=A0A818UKA8_9BILA|nr:unnamed protein product [Adineta steineri]CAF3694363.1 unnamed protein product [Adineta steineri]